MLGNVITVFRQLSLILVSLLIGATAAAVTLWVNLPFGDLSPLSALFQLAVLSLIGPIIFAWAAGPQPLSLVALIAAFVVPTLAIATFFLGYMRRRSFGALVFAATLWSGFGGYAAYLAATGSI